MKSYMAIVLGTLAAAGVVAASEEGTVEVDRNGDGYMTLGEVQAVFPTVTADVFSSVDTNKDGALDDEEMVAGQKKGLIPVSIGG